DSRSRAAGSRRGHSMTVSASVVGDMAFLSWAAYRPDGDPSISVGGEFDLSTNLAGSGWTIVHPNAQLGATTLDPDDEYCEVQVGSSGPIAGAFAAVKNGVLAISFRGSDENGDLTAAVNNQSGYFAAYASFLSAVLTYAANPAHGITQIYVTGHSLGGMMAEW